MIDVTKISNEEPFRKFLNLYKKALELNQKAIQAAVISSFSFSKNQSDSRFVNIKFIEKNKFIFFSNYSSEKAQQFEENNSISCLFFWEKINTQIRIKGNVCKTSDTYNKKYFSDRSKEKNALAISSQQSKEIDSFDEVLKRYEDVLSNKDTSICPKYWGGYQIITESIEFWEGDKFRLNKRLLFTKDLEKWKKKFLQP
jgi:pyridoxamine 5'-phosphate oxidase